MVVDLLKPQNRPLLEKVLEQLNIVGAVNTYMDANTFTPMTKLAYSVTSKKNERFVRIDGVVELPMEPASDASN